MKTRLFNSIFFWMVVTIVSAQSFTGVLREAKDLKDDGNYLEAASKYCKYRTEGLNGKQLLDVLFPEAECYYMLDDYQQLDTIISKYITCFRSCRSELGDSLDVYKAYLYKLLGNSLYGKIDISNPNSDSITIAEYYYESSMAAFEKRNNYDNYYALLHELVQLNYKAKRYFSAYKDLEKIRQYYRKRLDDGIFSDEPQYFNILAQIAICNARIAAEKSSDNSCKELFTLSISQIDSAIVYGQKRKDEMFYNWLRVKGKILMMQYDRLNIDNKKTAKNCYEQYINYHRNTIGSRLAQMTQSQQEQHWLALHDFLFDCYRLGEEAPEILYDLALFSKNYLLENHQTERLRWQDVRKALKTDDCALEFIQYRGTNDKSHLACLLLKKNSVKPQFIEIADNDSILGRELFYFDDESDTYYALPTEYCMTYQRGSLALSDVKDLLYSDSMLFSQIWTPQLMAAIGDAKNVYFSPDGFLHQLAIEYMMPDTLKECYRLSSTRVLTKKKEPIDCSKLLVCGGMNFHTKLNPHTYGNDVRAYYYFAGNGSVDELPETLKEIRTIMDIRNHPADTLLTGANATDENFMHLLEHNYPLVHISTHGYFEGKMESGTDLKPATTDISMSKSGFIFAGASSALTDKNFNTNMFDGVLSASEVAKFNMNGVDLVTLSACKTGLGDITADGIFGMQRALKMAGAKGLIVSLWNVKDLSSYILFSSFYEELEKQQEKDIHKAWKMARKKLKDYLYIYQYFNKYTLEEDTYKFKFDKPSDLFPYILIDIY